MNYIKHLTGFFDRIVQDNSLNPTHISLYISLFQFWNINRFQSPISITRDEVMRISKICSKATYHKCMRELNEKGYIKYEPSFNPFKGSMVILFNFSEDLKPVQKRNKSSKKFLQPTEQVLNKHKTSSETATEQALVPSINYINNTNILNDKNVVNLEKQSKNFEEINNSDLKNETEEMTFSFVDTDKNQTECGRQKEKKLRKKKKDEFVTSSEVEKPTIEEIKTYFQENNFPELEAQKFYNYFSSVGWLVGGKTPMVDWQASARNWMLNASKFKTYESNPSRAKQLNTTTDKDYSEPL